MSARAASDLRQRRAALRAALAERKASALAELARRRSALKKKEDPKKKRRWSAILLALLLLLLLRDCRCEEEPVGVASPAAGVSAQGEGVASPEAPALPSGKLRRQKRPNYAVEPTGPLPWIGALRLQVAARSPRLAACFVGAPRPGALLWTAAVEPDLGRVSDQELEPTLATEPLTKAQRDCALGVLSAPVYKLEGGEPRSTPVNVRLVIEF